MRQILVSIVAVFVSILLFASGNTLLGTLSSLRLTADGFGTALIGPVLACYSAGFVMGTLYASTIIRQVGHIRAASVFAACAGAASLLHPMAGPALSWGVLRGVVGFCISGLLVVVESWINSRATNENRGTLFSVYQVTFYLAAFGGQGMVALGDPMGYEPFSFTAILVSLALVPLALTRRGTPPPEETERLAFADLYHISPVGLVSAFISGVALAAFNMMTPAYGSYVGFSVDQVAVLMSLSVLGATLVAWPSGHFSDRVDRRLMLVFAGLVSGASALGIAMLGNDGAWTTYACAAIYMGFAATLYPLGVAVTNDRLQTHQMVGASAGLLFSHGLGNCVGPVGASLAMSLLGPPGLFAYLALLSAILVAFVGYRLARTPRVRPEEQDGFYYVFPTSTAVIAELDPRNERFEVSASQPDETEYSGVSSRGF